MTCGQCYPPLPDTPRADADVSLLRAQVRRVRDTFAVRGYDYVMQSCAWCTRSDLPLEVSRRRSGSYSYSQHYCSKDCGDADDAYQQASLTGQPTDGTVEEEDTR